MQAGPAIFRKTLGGFRPANAAAEEVASKVKLDSDVVVEIKRPRNLQHHRKFFALVNLVFENQDHYKSTDTLLTAIKVATGHVETVILKTGQTAFIPKSIAFHKMNQTEFEEFYERVLDIVAKHFIPGIDKEDLRAEAEAFLR